MRIISVARKPLAGSVAQTVLRYGTGGLNIDGCRIGPAFTSVGGNNFSVWRDAEGRTDLPPSHAIPSAQQVSGRWPTNVILQGFFVIQNMDAQSGVCPGMSGGGPSIDGGGSDLIPSYNRRATRPEFLRKDSGGSSRFFKQVK